MKNKVIHMSPITVRLVQKNIKTMITRLAVSNENENIIVPYKANDVLNVKESCALVGNFWRYRSDSNKTINTEQIDWIKPHDMPIQACRMMLIVKSVKMISLKDTTKDEAMKEGIIEIYSNKYKVPGFENTFVTWKEAFSALWNKSNAHKWKNGEKVLWRDNPKVWKIEFAKISVKKVKRLKQSRYNNINSYANR